VRTLIASALIAALVVPAVGPAAAQPAARAPGRPAPAPKPTVIALAPLSTLGSEDTSAAAKKLEAEIARELGAVAGVKVLAGAEITTAIKQAKKPMLRACDGEPTCLAELGALVGASHVVFGEVGGLGEVQVVYVVLVDVAGKKELRRAQVALGDPEQGGVRGGAVRLLDPDRYVGRLAVATPVAGAAIYVDGKRVGVTPAAGAAPPASLAVGAHALRVTHPEHRDFVRFVDITFDRETKVDVELVPYASVERQVAATGGPVTGGGARYVDTPPPWYRRWWAVAGFGAAVLTGAIVIGVATAGGVDSDAEGTVKPP